jgi:GntR family transcriptional regulator
MADHYAEQIRAGRLGVGDLLPSGSALEQTWGVSATTVRRMWEDLVGRGLVERQSGRGVVVVRRDAAPPVTLESLAARVAQLEQDRDRLAAEVQALRGQRP